MKTDTNDTTKNYAIEFYRFLFTCIIFILHFRSYGNFKSQNGQFNGGYLSVEFFFIVSGYLMMKKISLSDYKTIGNDVGGGYKVARFFASRYMRLMPLYWMSIGIFLIISCIMWWGIKDLKTSILKMLPEIFGLQMFWRPRGVSGYLWFISAMIWTQPLIFWFLQKTKETFIQIIAPLSLLLFITYIWKKYGHIDLGLQYEGFFRAFSEISFGCMIYCLVEYVNKNYTINTLFVTLVEVVLISSILIVMYRTRRDYKDFLMIFLIGSLVFFTFLNQGKISNILNQKIFEKLGMVSYAMYLNQMTFLNIAKKNFPGYSFWKTSIFLLLVLFVVSLLEIYIVNLISKLCNMISGLLITKKN